jgi:PAS domain S-box-containing protein
LARKRKLETEPDKPTRGHGQPQRAQTPEGRLLAAVFEHTTAGLAWFDRDFRFLRTNPAYDRATGRKGEELLGRSLPDVFPSEELQAAFEWVRDTGEANLFREFPYWFEDQPDRGVTYWDWTLTPVKDDQGQVESLVASISEVTHYVRAREAIAAAERQREQQRRLLEAIVENTRSQLAYLDRGFNFVQVNSAYAQGSGHAREELIGRNHFDLFPNAENQATFERVRDTGEAVEYREKPFEYADQPERGVTYWDWTLAPIRDEQGAVQGLVLSLTDMTAQVRAREQLLEAERARTRLAETLADEISHRMKNNLAIVAGLLLMQIADEPQDSRLAAVIREAVARLRAFAVVHEVMYSTHLECVELLSAVRSVAAISRELHYERHLEMAVRGDEVSYPARSATNICVVANELITNGIKHGRADASGSLKVRVRLALEDGALRLSVWNSGNPVPAGFDPAAQKTMGLRVVQTVVVDQHGGSFALTPQRGGTLAEIVVADQALREQR